MRLVKRLLDGLGMRDWRARAALVPAAGGALSWAAFLVFDRVLCAGAVLETRAGVGTVVMRRFRLVIGGGCIGICAVVGTTLGAGIASSCMLGTTLGAGVESTGILLVIERVMRRAGSSLFWSIWSTLGTGWLVALVGCPGWSASLSFEAMRLMSRMSWDASLFVTPWSSAAQSANAFMSLS